MTRRALVALRRMKRRRERAIQPNVHIVPAHAIARDDDCPDCAGTMHIALLWASNTRNLHIPSAHEALKK